MPSDRKRRRHTITPETPPDTASSPSPNVTAARDADNERRRKRATEAAGRATQRQKHATNAQGRVDAMRKRKGR